MGNKNKNAVLGLAFSVVVLAIFPFSSPVSGQASNPVIITWQANNYFPANYAGKAAATPGTPMIASVELIQNNKFTDLTQADIRWYVDGEMTASGMGLKTMSFSAKQRQSGYQTLRSVINVNTASFENSIQIPISQPSVIINIPSPDKTVRAGNQINLRATPFFFNVESLQGLSFDWLINDRRITGQGNSISMSIGTPQSEFQNSIPVSVTVQNSDNPYEFGRGFVNLYIIK